MILLETPKAHFESVSPAWELEMSARVDRSPLALPAVKKKLHRRAGACEPCRVSKLKCNGEKPCLRCGKRRDKPVCVYRVQPRRGRREYLRSSDSESPSGSESDHESLEGAVWGPEWDFGRKHGGPPQLLRERVPYGEYSLARCIDLFKSLPSEALSGIENETIRKCTGIEAFDNFQDQGIDKLIVGTLEVNNITELEQPYALIPEAIAQEMPGDLASIYKAITDIRHLVRVGRLVKAWLQVSVLVKITETICGMGQQRPSARSAEEVELIRRLWWLVLELEVQIGIHVGQPLNVSARFLDGVERPTLEGLDPDTKILENSKLDFRQAALDVLGKIDEDVHVQVAAERYEDLVELMNLDRLSKMQERLPQQPLVPGDSINHIAIADHRIEFFAFKMLLACVLASVSQQARSSKLRGDTNSKIKLSPLRAKQVKGIQKQRYEYQKDILNSAMEILKNFEVLYQIRTAEGTTNWTRCYAAYCAVCILAIAALRREKSLDSSHQIIIKVHAIFSGLAQRNPSCTFAKLASSRIAALSVEIRKLKPQSPTQASQGRRVKRARSPSMLKPALEPSTASSSQGLNTKRKSSVTEEHVAPRLRRKRPKVESSAETAPTETETLSFRGAAADSQQSQMIQHDPTSSRSFDLMHSAAYPNQYHHTGVIHGLPSHEHDIQMVPASAPWPDNGHLPYLYQYNNPPILNAAPPLLSPEGYYILSPLAMDTHMSYGHGQYLETGTMNSSRQTQSMPNAPLFTNLDPLPTWENPLPGPATTASASFGHMSAAGPQARNIPRTRIGRHNSFPHIYPQMTSVQMSPSHHMVIDQAMQGSSAPHLVETLTTNSMGYSMTPSLSGPSQPQQIRPTVSRSWTDSSPATSYAVQHVFQPYQEDEHKEEDCS